MLERDIETILQKEKESKEIIEKQERKFRTKLKFIEHRNSQKIKELKLSLIEREKEAQKKVLKKIEAETERINKETQKTIEQLKKNHEKNKEKTKDLMSKLLREMFSC